MFHNSTTIQHNHSEANFSNKENRLVFGAWNTVKEGMKSAGENAVKGGGYIKKASMWGPIKYIFPLHYVYKYSAKGVAWAYKKALWAGHTGIEASKGVVGEKNSIGRGFFDLATTPINALYRMFTTNFRSVIGGVLRTPYELGSQAVSGTYHLTKSLFSTPYNLIRHPFKSVIGMKNSVVHAVKSVRDRTANVMDDAMHLNFGKLAKGFRDNVAGVLKAPFRAVAKPWQSLTRTPREIISNDINAAKAYPEGISNLVSGIRSGIGRILSAPATASAKLGGLAEEAPAAAH